MQAVHENFRDDTATALSVTFLIAFLTGAAGSFAFFVYQSVDMIR